MSTFESVNRINKIKKQVVFKFILSLTPRQSVP